MTKLNYTITLLCLTLVLLTACKKEEEPSCLPPCPCEGDACLVEMKEWFYFQEGSYWIYEEVNSGALDTVRVYEAFESDVSFVMRTESSVIEEYVPGSFGKFQYRYNYTGSRSCLTRENCTCHKLERTKGRPFQFVGAGTMALYPFITDDYIFSSGGGFARTEGRADSLELGGVVYSDVVRILNSESITEGGRPVEFYYAKDIGMIRKHLFEDDEDWQLVEYQVIQ